MNDFRYFLGIETSCDETAVGIFDAQNQKMLSNTIFTQIDLHKKFGGVMPEVASRSHLEKIGPIFQMSLDEAKINIEDVSFVGVTTHPGLHGSLLVGVCFAKAVSLAASIPILSIDHNHGHIVSALLSEDRSLRQDVQYPFLCLSVSGGHTSFYLVESETSFKLIGETIDDAAGEAYDKVGKLLNLPYPGGPIIEKLALIAGNNDFFKYPRSKDKSTLNFSFSGIKTAVLYSLVKLGVYTSKFELIKENESDEIKQKVASSFQVAVADIFDQKLSLALKIYPEVKSVFLVGGVSCNKYIVARLKAAAEKFNKPFFCPPREFCTDNGAMIALATYFQAKSGQRHTFEDIELDRKS